MAKKVESTEKFKTMIGGQALIEGIMMLGPDKSSVVVRKKDGLRIKTEPRKVSEGFSLKKLPLIRGVFNFCASMKMGVTALLYSADVYAEDYRVIPIFSEAAASIDSRFGTAKSLKDL